jgi:N-acetylglucosaminyldiphosphoundecaprenol N-acetyl-beta-D-mannosaminyltransferase
MGNLGLMKESLLGYDVDSGTLAEIVEGIVDSIESSQSRRWLACLNPHSYVVSLKDQQFANALRAADWLVPDGIGIVLASRVLRGTIRQRVSGPDVFTALHQRLNRLPHRRVFFLGGTPETLVRIGERMEVEFPNIRVAGTYSPPFKPYYSAEERLQVTEVVNASRADVLWVGLTAPKQEKWIYENKDALNVRFIGAVGAAFDFYAGTIRPSPSFFRRHGLEWLPRLAQQPQRLWRRTFVSAPVFAWLVLRARMRGEGLETHSSFRGES